jgi:hypothetical protein
MAKVQLARRFLESALDAAQEAHRRLETVPVEEWDEYMRLTLIEALIALDRKQEADVALDRAFRTVSAHAAAIGRADHRRAFLTRNEEVRRIVELSRERLGLEEQHDEDQGPGRPVGQGRPAPQHLDTWRATRAGRAGGDPLPPRGRRP